MSEELHELNVECGDIENEINDALDIVNDREIQEETRMKARRFAEKTSEVLRGLLEKINGIQTEIAFAQTICRSLYEQDADLTHRLLDKKAQKNFPQA